MQQVCPGEENEMSCRGPMYICNRQRAVAQVPDPAATFCAPTKEATVSSLQFLVSLGKSPVIHLVAMGQTHGRRDRGRSDDKLNGREPDVGCYAAPSISSETHCYHLENWPLSWAFGDYFENEWTNAPAFVSDGWPQKKKKM